ncbi:cytochrome P450 [Auriscalpium vulgare]|uniref:Cytochrome P450 n=1 Tax=Auriscalpium vulgare TaxID=40419 RepID=A0ACB8RUZ2_9AGAM|nr:cytochrome P450 [Auriscalpium vulgare]
MAQYDYLTTPLHDPTIVGGLTLALLLTLLVQYRRSPWRRVPPGPRGLPLLGNVRQLRNRRWLFFQSRKEHGDVVYLNVAGQPIVLLNTQEAAADLLDRRASIYSGRPHFVVASEILTGGMFLVYAQYGDMMRRMRRAAQEGLSKAAVKQLHPIQRREALLLAQGLLTDTQADHESRVKHFRRSSASMIMSVTYGVPSMDSVDHPMLQRIDALIERLAHATIPGAHLVEMFHWMRHVPRWLAKWKRDAERHFEEDTGMFEKLVDMVRTDLVKGIDRPSLSASLIKNETRNELSKREQAWLAGIMYAAGAETTSNTLSWWLLAMLSAPDVQARAQAELDSVVGRARPPTLADAPHLPYIRATVQEALRWRPVLPFAIPHRLAQDDWYRGMFLPAGTLVFPNLWQCNSDERVYGADAARFDPARHLDARAGPPETRGEGHVMYGFGRRACVGKHVANDSLFIDIAMVLWAAKVEPVAGAAPVDVQDYVDDGFICRPPVFDCKITPRFPEVISILGAEREMLEINT